MKKYRVSLAIKVPSNFEIEVAADSEKEALKITLDKFENKFDEGEIVEPDYYDGTELDIKEKDYNKDKGGGIYIEEIEEQ